MSLSRHEAYMRRRAARLAEREAEEARAEMAAPPAPEGPEEEAALLDRVREATRTAGYDPDYFCGLDRAMDVPYHVDPGSSERIWVVGLGRPRPLAEVSPIVDVLRGWQVGRTIVICPREVRDQLAGESE